jgi:hypothetical protein
VLGTLLKSVFCSLNNRTFILKLYCINRPFYRLLIFSLKIIDYECYPGWLISFAVFASCRSTNQQVKVESQKYLNKKKVQVKKKLNQLLKDESFAVT